MAAHEYNANGRRVDRRADRGDLRLGAALLATDSHCWQALFHRPDATCSRRRDLLDAAPARAIEVRELTPPTLLAHARTNLLTILTATSYIVHSMRFNAFLIQQRALAT